MLVNFTILKQELYKSLDMLKLVHRFNHSLRWESANINIDSLVHRLIIQHTGSVFKKFSKSQPFNFLEGLVF